MLKTTTLGQARPARLRPFRFLAMQFSFLSSCACVAHYNKNAPSTSRLMILVWSTNMKHRNMNTPLLRTLRAECIIFRRRGGAQVAAAGAGERCLSAACVVLMPISSLHFKDMGNRCTRHAQQNHHHHHHHHHHHKKQILLLWHINNT